MSTYTIRPTGKGFGVFSGRTWLGKPRIVADHERLFEAEMHALHCVTQDYHKQLDYHRLTNQTMTTEMMIPRTNEEHIYTALVLAGKRPFSTEDNDESNFAPRVRNPDDDRAYEGILEAHLGKPISMVVRTMFEERFMTWYGQNHPEWVDPRREREYDVGSMRRGRNRYNSAVAGAGVTMPPGLAKRFMKALRDKLNMFKNARPTEYESAGQASAGPG